MSRQFLVNAPSVVSEVIDGEAVIMNLVTGHYFSARGTGAFVWQWLERGGSDAAAADALAAAYGIAPDEATLAVRHFVADLEAHALVTEAGPDAVAPDAAALAELPGLPTEGEAAPWAAPALSVYTDMEDLLLLDPIHDVSEAGWPMPKGADAPAEAA